MTIEVCMGSSCHAKGASRVLDMLRKAISENNLEDKINLSGTLCLGQCAEPGANMKIDGEIVTDITEENFPDFFENRIKKLLANN
ncbi:MAG: (2Fe-2S) ferredoxin domain-containing protein [Spirochaetaceae bacterium]|nr:(2Fe-2S) ferredoxin domain-containing protein [Spirochaetaceae bacterium]